MLLKEKGLAGRDAVWGVCAMAPACVGVCASAIWGSATAVACCIAEVMLSSAAAAADVELGMAATLALAPPWQRRELYQQHDLTE